MLEIFLDTSVLIHHGEFKQQLIDLKQDGDVRIHIPFLVREEYISGRLRSKGISRSESEQLLRDEFGAHFYFDEGSFEDCKRLVEPDFLKACFEKETKHAGFKDACILSSIIAYLSRSSQSHTSCIFLTTDGHLPRDLIDSLTLGTGVHLAKVCVSEKSTADLFSLIYFGSDIRKEVSRKLSSLNGSPTIQQQLKSLVQDVVEAMRSDPDGHLVVNHAALIEFLDSRTNDDLLSIIDVDLTVTSGTPIQPRMKQKKEPEDEISVRILFMLSVNIRGVVARLYNVYGKAVFHFDGSVLGEIKKIEFDPIPLPHG